MASFLRLLLVAVALMVVSQQAMAMVAYVDRPALSQHDDITFGIEDNTVQIADVIDNDTKDVGDDSAPVKGETRRLIRKAEAKIRSKRCDTCRPICGSCYCCVA